MSDLSYAQPSLLGSDNPQISKEILTGTRNAKGAVTIWFKKTKPDMETRYLDRSEPVRSNLENEEAIMPRKKLYPEEFLVRATTEELRLIDELARKGKTSRSRFLITAALTGGSKAAADLPLFEAMMEARGLALLDLRRVRHRLERITNLHRLQSSGGTCNPNLDKVIEDLATTITLVRKVWPPSEP